MMRALHSGYLRRWQQWWQQRLPRERAILIAGTGLVALTLAWLLLWQPAAQGIAQLKNELPALRSQNAALQTMAAEASALRAGRRASARLPAAERLTALRQSLEAAGIVAEVSSTNEGHANEQAQVRIANIDYAVWINWLASAETALGARTTRAEIKALTPPASLAAGHVQVDLLFDFSGGR